MPTGEPASAVRSPRHDPCGKPSLCLLRVQGPLACGHEQTSSVNERKGRGWGGGVVGDRRVGSVDERNRETRRARRCSWPRGPKSRPPGVRTFAAHSDGFRPGRGCREAVARVEELLSQGHVWCVDADLKRYFDTLAHAGLMALVRERIVDGSVLALLEQRLKAGVLEELKGWQPTERGTPQGAVIRPLLANLYLNPLDHAVAQRGWAMVRYADDFGVLCRTREEAETVLDFVRHWTEAAGLTLHPTQTRIVHAGESGFDFLGWHFRGGKQWPRKKSLQKRQDKLRPLTRRTNGRSLSEIIAQANPILRGWHGYFRESHRTGLSGPDGWLRRRLRALLRQREQRPGYGLNEADSRRWPNRWFAARGLFSLEHGTCA